MKLLLAGVLVAGSVALAPAQYLETAKMWKVSPELMVVRYLPGVNFGADGNLSYGLDGGYQYSGFGGVLQVRFTNVNIPGIAFTISGGATSFYRPDYSGIVVPTVSMPGWNAFAASTLGGDPHLRDFFVFPASLGVQAFWPFDGMEKFRMFAGAEAAAYFVDGSVAPHAQTRFGYAVAGGFGVGIVELGARYAQFADMKNIGVFLGLCLKTYEF
jgi:hypothetical protein